jgi:hypothetical protein
MCDTLPMSVSVTCGRLAPRLYRLQMREGDKSEFKWKHSRQINFNLLSRIVKVTARFVPVAVLRFQFD